MRKHSTAHYWNKPEAGTGWNQLERAKRQRELNCGFTLFGWDGDTLARESSPAQDEGDTGKTVHYLYEPAASCRWHMLCARLRYGCLRLKISKAGMARVRFTFRQTKSLKNGASFPGLNHHNR
ncbi:hypothetical protein NWF32_02075 [Pseudomonas qingdaonensis]|nr:hypothetical protein [Pseudomonas qingdaonensis]